MIVHTVKKGETLSKIAAQYAKKYGLTSNQMMEAIKNTAGNEAIKTNPNKLEINQKINLPLNNPPKTQSTADTSSIKSSNNNIQKYEDYQIKKGDNLSTIIQSQATAQLIEQKLMKEAILKANEGLRAHQDNINVGSILKIPIYGTPLKLESLESNNTDETKDQGKSATTENENRESKRQVHIETFILSESDVNTLLNNPDKLFQDRKYVSLSNTNTYYEKTAVDGKTKFVSHSENIPASNHNIFELKDGKAIESEDKKYYEAIIPHNKTNKTFYIEAENIKNNTIFCQHDWAKMGFQVVKGDEQSHGYLTDKKQLPIFQEIYQKIQVEEVQRNPYLPVPHYFLASPFKTAFKDKRYDYYRRRIIAQHPTEWQGLSSKNLLDMLKLILVAENDQTKLADYMYMDKDFAKSNIKQAQAMAIFFHEQERIKELAFWNDVPELTTKMPFHVHPIALVGNARVVLTSDCGCKLGPIFTHVKYNSLSGPRYSGQMSLSAFPFWNSMISDNRITESEKRIIIAMSKNEGNMDAIQAYDDQIVTLGAMQKTVNQKGRGEFPAQIAKFKKNYADLYFKFFENCGWYVSSENSPTMYYVDPISNKKYESNELNILIKSCCKGVKFGVKVESKPLAALLIAIKNKEFLKLQVEDFVIRLKNALSKKPTGYDQRIKNYVKTDLGKATVLDQDVNRPSHVSKTFGKALDIFFSRYTKISKDPGKWTSQDEILFLDIYGPERGNRKNGFTMTDAQQRYNSLVRKLR